MDKDIVKASAALFEQLAAVDAELESVLDDVERIEVEYEAALKAALEAWSVARKNAMMKHKNASLKREALIDAIRGTLDIRV